MCAMRGHAAMNYARMRCERVDTDTIESNGPNRPEQARIKQKSART